MGVCLETIIQPTRADNGLYAIFKANRMCLVQVPLPHPYPYPGMPFYQWAIWFIFLGKNHVMVLYKKY